MSAKTTNCSNTPVKHLGVELAASCRDEVRLEDRDLKCNLVL